MCSSNSQQKMSITLLVVEEAVDPIDDEDDPDIVEWFSGLGGLSTGNYHPFPSKIFAFLFFLVNSPHPMVSRLL